jgi:hypothetical protein
MEATVELPKAFSVRDDRELPLIQDLMARMNPKLLVVQVATGMHIDGGYTVNWGLVYMDGQPLTDADVAAALKEAGLDAQHNAEIQLPRIWVDNDPGVTETPPTQLSFQEREARGKASIVLKPTPTAGMVPVGEEAKPIFRKDIEMKRFLAVILIAALGVFIIGCESQKGTTENKTETKISQSKNGKLTGETTTTVDTKTTITPSTPGGGGTTTEKTTKKTTETTK